MGMKKRDKIIYGTVIGGAIGSVLGLMYAPQSGKKTRKQISDAYKSGVKKGKSTISKNVKDLKKTTKGKGIGLFKKRSK